VGSIPHHFILLAQIEISRRRYVSVADIDDTKKQVLADSSGCIISLYGKKTLRRSGKEKQINKH
jgi:hypothetical protein